VAGLEHRYLATTHQVDAELDVLIEVFKAASVWSFLEIGSKFGSSLWRVARALPSGSRIVSVDLNTNGPSLGLCIAALREKGYDARLIAGNSMDVATIDKVRRLGPFDALFIDGNHKLMYVESDWRNYGAMAKIVAFHDIGWRRSSPASPNRILVPEFWNSIKDAHRHREILLDPDQNAYGIGVIWR
jgi:predicted O-methyltransferase YrrM